MALSAPLFLISLAAVAGSVFLSRSSAQVRGLFAVPEQFVELLTSLGAGSPEIASAIVAMMAGQRDVRADVIFGTNLFNPAFLLDCQRSSRRPVRTARRGAAGRQRRRGDNRIRRARRAGTAARDRGAL